MSYFGSTEWYQRVVAGEVDGGATSIVHKFGYANLGTTLQTITHAGIFQTPTTAQALEFVSSSANDISTGSGAREVTVVGLNGSWAEISQTVATNGTTAVALTTDLVRLTRWYVSASGTYGTAEPANGSHAGTLTIRADSAGATWTTIPITPWAFGQSLIGCYSVPTGKTAYLVSVQINVDSARSVDIVIARRDNADDVTTPFTGAMRTLLYHVGIKGESNWTPSSPNSGIVGPADIIAMGKVTSGSADVSVDMEILLTTT